MLTIPIMGPQDQIFSHNNAAVSWANRQQSWLTCGPTILIFLKYIVFKLSSNLNGLSVHVQRLTVTDMKWPETVWAANMHAIVLLAFSREKNRPTLSQRSPLGGREISMPSFHWEDIGSVLGPDSWVHSHHLVILEQGVSPICSRLKTDYVTQWWCEAFITLILEGTNLCQVN